MDPTIQWLMEGDPAIRWQILRDLLDAPAEEWQAERRKTIETGWGAALLARQDPDGRWGGGIYSPKWTSSTYTLLLLRQIGIPPDEPRARIGAGLVIDQMLGAQRDDAFERKLAVMDRCIAGMILELAVYFGFSDARVDALVDNLLAERMPDGGWNCRRGRVPKTHHSSFHTTFNALEGLRDWIERRGGSRLDEVLAAERGALELLLRHRLFKSDQTGAVIDYRFALLSFPYRWHYDLLRGLDYFARANAPRDPRLEDAIGRLVELRRADGAWPLQYKYTGKAFFDMEKLGKPSRWNTLRALRVLRWWNATPTHSQ